MFFHSYISLLGGEHPSSEAAKSSPRVCVWGRGGRMFRFFGGGGGRKGMNSRMFLVSRSFHFLLCVSRQYTFPAGGASRAVSISEGGSPGFVGSRSVLFSDQFWLGSHTHPPSHKHENTEILHSYSRCGVICFVLPAITPCKSPPLRPRVSLHPSVSPVWNIASCRASEHKNTQSCGYTLNRPNRQIAPELATNLPPFFLTGNLQTLPHF